MRFEYLRGDELVARGEQETACLRVAGDEVEPAPIPVELREALARYDPAAA
jgi:enediyne biosynthesis thioesterase